MEDFDLNLELMAWEKQVSYNERYPQSHKKSQPNGITRADPNSKSNRKKQSQKQEAIAA